MTILDLNMPFWYTLLWIAISAVGFYILGYHMGNKDDR